MRILALISHVLLKFYQMVVLCYMKLGGGIFKTPKTAMQRDSDCNSLVPSHAFELVLATWSLHGKVVLTSVQPPSHPPHGGRTLRMGPPGAPSPAESTLHSEHKRRAGVWSSHECASRAKPGRHSRCFRCLAAGCPGDHHRRSTNQTYSHSSLSRDAAPWGAPSQYTQGRPEM